MIPHLTCMALAAALNDLPPRALPAIHAVEGGAPGSVHWNANGSADLGVMQINTLWLPALVGALGQPEAVIRDRLVRDACFNIVVAGMILRLYLDEERGDLWRAIGNYHSHTPSHHQAYRSKVAAAARKLGIAIE